MGFVAGCVSLIAWYAGFGARCVEFLLGVWVLADVAWVLVRGV